MKRLKYAWNSDLGSAFSWKYFMKMCWVRDKHGMLLLAASYLLNLLWNSIYTIARGLREMWVGISALHLSKVSNIRLTGNQGISLYLEPHVPYLSLATMHTLCVGSGEMQEDMHVYSCLPFWWVWRCCTCWISYPVYLCKAN